MRASRVTSESSLLRRAAFTLIEVLVSMTVLSIIVIMLTSLLSSSLKILNSSESDQERHRNGRALTDFIGKELRQALLPVEIKANANQPNLQLVINPPQITGSTYLNADSIFWQAPLATDSTYGDIAEVGYFVRWITTGSTITPTLCRFFVNPSVTDPTTNKVTQNTDNFLIYTNLTGWVTPSLLDALAPADNNAGANGQKNGYIGLFAENVLGIWVQSYGIDGVELAPSSGSSRGSFDSRQGYKLATGQLNNAKEYRYLPALIKVSIAQIDTKYGARLSPAANEIRTMTQSSVNAADFLRKAQADTGSPAVQAIAPGIRIYSTDVFLDNGR